MLARVADNLYWMSRYLERADQTARLLGVQVSALADQPAAVVADGWRRLFFGLGATPPGGDSFLGSEEQETFLLADAYSLTDYMTFETGNPSSIVSLWGRSRENARQARQEITSEMWGHLNRPYLTLRDQQLHTFWNQQPHLFYRETSASIYLFRGVTDNSLRHGSSWDFIRLGRFLERIQVTTGILDAYRSSLEDSDGNLDWSLLLRSCASFEPFCKLHTATILPHRAMSFLIYDPQSPHTLRFAAEEIRTSLQRIDPVGDARDRPSPVHRTAGRLRALLAYGFDEADRAAAFGRTLTRVRRFARQLHDEVYRRHIFYQADQAFRVT